VEGDGLILWSMAHDGQIYQKISKCWTTVQSGANCVTLLLHPTVANNPNIKMEQRNHGRSAGYAASWSMVLGMTNDKMKLWKNYGPASSSKMSEDVPWDTNFRKIYNI
jgi:hypothetical protein